MEVTKAGKHEVTNAVAPTTRFKFDDIIISKVILCQGKNPIKKKGVKEGELFMSEDEGVLKENPEFVVLDGGDYITWQILENENKARIEQDSPRWNLMPWEGEMVNGTLVQCRKIYNFHVLLSDQVKEGMTFPVVISFKGGSTSNGKKLNKKLMLLDFVGKKWNNKVFTLAVDTAEGKSGDEYLQILAKDARDATPEEINLATMWEPMVGGMRVSTKEFDAAPTPAVDSEDVPY